MHKLVNINRKEKKRKGKREIIWKLEREPGREKREKEEEEEKRGKEKKKRKEEGEINC